MFVVNRSIWCFILLMAILRMGPLYWLILIVFLNNQVSLWVRHFTFGRWVSRNDSCIIPHCWCRISSFNKEWWCLFWTSRGRLYDIVLFYKTLVSAHFLIVKIMDYSIIKDMFLNIMRLTTIINQLYCNWLWRMGWNVLTILDLELTRLAWIPVVTWWIHHDIWAMSMFSIIFSSQ